eukprot:313664-Chlamydomonas_euryale.AAC.2
MYHHTKQKKQTKLPALPRPPRADAQICDKQYTKAMELDAHLSSYDHHHRKRLVEMRSMHAERTRGERERREAKNADRELKRLQKQ